VHSTDSRVVAALEPLEGTDGREARIIATLISNAVTGWALGNVVVSTSSTSMPELRIPVRADSWREVHK
jgi:hypothetical protein